MKHRREQETEEIEGVGLRDNRKRTSEWEGMQE